MRKKKEAERRRENKETERQSDRETERRKENDIYLEVLVFIICVMPVKVGERLVGLYRMSDQSCSISGTRAMFCSNLNTETFLFFTLSFILYDQEVL